MDLPKTPPFAIRARILTPLAAGGTRHEPDGLLVVDETGRLASVGAAADAPPEVVAAAIDLRPWVVLPGMVDTHAHLPQLPNAGLGFALDLLTWLDRVTFPTERSWSDPAVAERLAPAIFEAFAAAGTTTVLAYGVVYEAAMDAAFRAAEAHGIRAILGKVMMDRETYDPTIEPWTILERSMRESADLIARWHGADDGRLGYAVTPRFAISCTPEMLRESADLARATGAWWQTHVSEDPFEIAEVRRLFPEALDYVDVYDRAGGLGERTVLAHAIHLSDRELGRLVETGTRVAHCPASNLFIGAGVMPLARYLEAGLTVGLGSDVVRRAGGLDLLGHAGRGLRADGAPLAGERGRRRSSIRSTGCGWAPSRARASSGWTTGSDRWRRARRRTSSRSTPRSSSALPGAPADDEPADLMSRLIFRAHPDMVRAAWVRGRRRLAGPGRT